MTRRILIIFTILSTFFTVRAQSLKVIDPKDKGAYKYWLYSPASDSDSTAVKPLIVFLHGASLSGPDINKVKKYGPLDAINRGLKLDAYVAAPQTLRREGWTPRKVMKVVDDVIAQNANVDTTRIYLIGMSMGGSGTLKVVSAYPNRIAAALAFCGGNPAINYKNLSQVPFWIIHGTADRDMSISGSDNVAKNLKAASGDNQRFIYTRVKGMNHSHPARFFCVPQFYQWLFQHSLSDPERPVAEDFPVDMSLVHRAYDQIPLHPETIKP